MKSQLLVLLFASSLLVVSGCGGSSGPTNVKANADAEAVQSYKDAVAAEQAKSAKEMAGE